MNNQQKIKETNQKIESALIFFKSGKPVIVVDDENRENEGDLIYAAEFMTQTDVAFMLQHTSGIICVPCLPQRLDELHLPLMVVQNTSKHGCAFTVSVDAKNAHTGVSAQDRLLAISALISSQTKPTDLVQPGHIFPLRAQQEGVLQRSGHTEAAIDLCRLSSITPVAVLAELMHQDGTMMRGASLSAFAKEHSIPLISIADIISYRMESEKKMFVKNKVVENKFVENNIAENKESISKISSFIRHDAIHLPTSFGDFTLIPYEDLKTHLVHLALVKGTISSKKPVLVRVHSECLTGDVFGSTRCDCGDQLATALELIEKEDNGILLYLRQEGRGIGLLAKLQAYHLQEKGFDTVEANEMLGYPADSRDYSLAASLLQDLGVTSVRLLTNNPKKITALTAAGIVLAERVPLELPASVHNKVYMQTKKEKLGHLFDHV